MARPLNRNDLKRVKSNLKNPVRKFPIASSGENFIDIKLNDFATPDTLAVDSTNTLGVSADLNLSPFNLNTGDFILNTISENNTIFSPGSIEVSRNIGGDKVTDSPNHVLYYQGPKPIEVSNNLVQPLPDENFEIRVSFYNEENFKQSTASFPISVINFRETDESKMIQLSGIYTDTQVVTISTDKFQSIAHGHGGRVTPLGFTISLLDKANKRFLTNGLLLTQPVSVFKDDKFLTSIEHKLYPKLSQSRPISAHNDKLKKLINNNARIFNFSVETWPAVANTGIELPLSATNLIEELKTDPGKIYGPSTTDAVLSGLEDFKFSLGAYKNRGLEDGVIMYQSFLSAGKYEFKFNLKDQDNRFNNNNITTSIPISVVEVERDMVTPSLSTIFSVVSTNPVYTNFNHLRLFTAAADTEPVTWNTNFWAYTARDIFNFSGVHWKGNQNATLITPRHAVCAEHYRAFGTGKKVGDILYFYDHTTGNPVSAVVDKVFNLDDQRVTAGLVSNPYGYPNGTNYRSISAFFDIDDLTNSIEELSGSYGRIISDCTLLHLDRDVVSGNDIKVYPIAKRIHNDVAYNKYPAILTGGRKRNTHGDNVALGFTHEHKQDHGINLDFLGNISTGRTEPTAQMGPPDGSNYVTLLATCLTATPLSGIFTDSILLTAYEFGEIIDGDSGNPNFVILDNQLSLVTTNFKGGFMRRDISMLPITTQDLNFERVANATGPNFTNADTQVILQSAVDLIGNTEGYRISAIDMV